MEMRNIKTGISIPECVISEPKLQRVIGFNYFYYEETNIFEDDALRSVRRITPDPYCQSWTRSPYADFLVA